MTSDELAHELCHELAGNFTDGASVLARRALHLVVQYGQRTGRTTSPEILVAFADRLATVRPSMYAIARVLQEWKRLFKASPGDGDAAEGVAREVMTRIDLAGKETVTLAAAELTGVERMLTHSDSSTVRRVVASLDPRVLRVTVTTSEPGGEGRRFAEWLASAGYACELLRDEEAVAKLARTDCFVVGADAVLPNGDIVNKVGTRTLAEAAQKRGVSVIVVAESFKNAPGEVPMESTSSGPLFDVTPGGLITKRVGDNLFPTDANQTGRPGPSSPTCSS